MAPTLQVTSGTPSLQTPGSDPFFIAGDLTNSATDLVYQSAGVISGLAIRLTANATTATSPFVLLKNGSNGNETITIPLGASGIGLFQDTTNTDAIAATDGVHLQINGTGGNFTISLFSSLFTATTNTVSKLVSSSTGTTFTVATTYYIPIQGSLGVAPGQTVETFQKSKVKQAGTIKNLNIQISQGGSSNSTYFVRQNGANSAITLVENGTTGNFTDSTHTFAVAAGDDINYSVALTGTVSTTVSYLSVEYETTSGYGISSCSLPAGYAQPDSTTEYHGIGGGIRLNATESVVQTKASAAFTFSNMGFMVSVVDTTVGTLSFRKNTANALLTVSNTASATGYFEDATHTDVCAAGDLVDVAMVTSIVSGSHNLTASFIRIDTLIASVTIPQTVWVEWEES